MSDKVKPTLTPEDQAAADLKRLEEVIRNGLNFITAEHATWIAMQAAVQHYVDNETRQALAPSQTSDTRAYNNGRAAVMRDFQHFLATKWQQAQE